MASSSNTRVMEKPGQELLQQQQQALKCPRCDSSNTKFCYYNNYSLSQPRHFCKACKRYWTRGGTLRNVPVGGGCRKNKRVKRVDTSNNNNASPSPSSSNPSSNNSKSNLPSKSHIDAASTTSSYINTNTLYYGLHTTTASHNSCDVNVMDLNPIFPRVSSYDLHPQLNNALGFGFGSNNSNTTALLSNAYNSIFGGSSTCAPSNPVMASLLSSTLLQQKFMKDNDHGSNNFQGLGSLEEMVASKEMKVEGQNRNMVESWNNNNGGGVNSNCQNNSNQMEHVGFSDPSSLYWNTASAWSDQLPNIGPNSVTSLI